mmetsp:Transcript_15844/g.33496  ORF Transcript_15844/g.33496 Transcript_15844/m.33496 type:complete len:255 (+) Transcript_15844:656-1420(+)
MNLLSILRTVRSNKKLSADVSPFLLLLLSFVPIGIVVSIVVVVILRPLGIGIDIAPHGLLILHLQLHTLRSLLQIKLILVHGLRAAGHIRILVAVVQAVIRVVGIVAITVLTDVIAVVLLGVHLRLQHGLHEVTQLNDIVGSVLATPAGVRWAELEVHEFLLVHAGVVVAVFVVVVAVLAVVAIALIIVSIGIVVVVVVVGIEVAAVVIFTRGTGMELEGVARNPREFITAIETTCLRKEVLPFLRFSLDLDVG